MNSPLDSEPRGSQVLRAISFATAVLLFLHVAAFPIYWGFGSLMIFGPQDDYRFAGTILTVSMVISAAAFFLASQLYLNSKRS